MKSKILNRAKGYLNKFKMILIGKTKESVSEQKMKFSKKVLIYSFTILTIYAFGAMFIRVKFGIEPNSNLTDNIHRIWGLEIALLMLKTIIDDFRDIKNCSEETKEKVNEGSNDN